MYWDRLLAKKDGALLMLEILGSILNYGPSVSEKLANHCVFRTVWQGTRYSNSLGNQLLKKGARLLNLNDDKDRLTTRDNSEVARTLSRC